MRRMYMAVGPNCWGRGTTEQKAYLAMKENAPRPYRTSRKIVPHIMYEAPEAADMYVNQMGYVMFKGNVEPVEIRRIGDWR